MKIDFYGNFFFQIEIGDILIDLNSIFSMKPSEFKFSISVESYGK